MPYSPFFIRYMYVYIARRRICRAVHCVYIYTTTTESILNIILDEQTKVGFTSHRRRRRRHSIKL